MEWLANEFTRIERVVLFACFAFAVFYVLYIFFVKKSFIAMIVALLTAGIFIWGVNNIGWFQDRVADETKKKEKADLSKPPNVPIMNRPGMVVVILPRSEDR